MAGIGAMLKLMKGDIGPDGLAELLSAMGLQLDVRLLSDEEKKAAFQSTATAAVAQGADVLHFSGVTKDGKRMHALVVSVQDASLSSAEFKPGVRLTGGRRPDVIDLVSAEKSA